MWTSARETLRVDDSLGHRDDDENVSEPTHYPARYSDGVGTEPIVIVHKDGELSTTIRGVDFVGSDFDGLEPTGPSEGKNLTLSAGSLCACTLEWAERIAVDTPAPLHPSAPIVAALHARLELGAPNPPRGIDRECVSLSIAYESVNAETVTAKSQGEHGWLVDALVSLKVSLPPGDSLRACFACRLSDYSPLGHGFSGDLMCFRDRREAFLAVEDKASLMELQAAHRVFVHETNVCDAFERQD